MEDRYTTPGTVLRDEKTREIIKKGQKVKSFRGETMTVLGWQTHGAGSTGRVLVKWGGPKANAYTQEFFPSVVGAFIDESGCVCQNGHALDGGECETRTIAELGG